MPKEISTHQVPSDSNPHKSYTVTVYDTHSECECQAWIRSRLPNTERVCKHIESVTGELRKGDAKLSNAELLWVLMKLSSVTDLGLHAVAEAVELELATNYQLSNYHQTLAGNLVEALYRYDDGVPGPDARQALGIIRLALE